MPITQIYIPAAIMREYLAIMGRRDDDGGPMWAEAQQDIIALLAEARRVGEPSKSGAVTFRTGRIQTARGSRRLELSVSYQQRPEGPLPQLVRVRAK